MSLNVPTSAALVPVRVGESMWGADAAEWGRGNPRPDHLVTVFLLYDVSIFAEFDSYILAQISALCGHDAKALLSFLKRRPLEISRRTPTFRYNRISPKNSSHAGVLEYSIAYSFPESSHIGEEWAASLFSHVDSPSVRDRLITTIQELCIDLPEMSSHALDGLEQDRANQALNELLSIELRHWGEFAASLPPDPEWRVQLHLDIKELRRISEREARLFITFEGNTSGMYGDLVFSQALDRAIDATLHYSAQANMDIAQALASERKPNIVFPAWQELFIRRKYADFVKQMYGPGHIDEVCKIIDIFDIPDMMTIAVMIKAGDVDLLSLHSRFAPVRRWLAENLTHDGSPPKNLLKDLLQRALSRTALSRGPYSVLRFAVFEAIGRILDVAMPLASLPLSAFNTFLFERLVGRTPPHVHLGSISMYLARKKGITDE